MRTIQYDFILDNKSSEYNETQFCVETIDEGDEMFEEFLNDEGINPDNIKSLMVYEVYSNDDADIYGESYNYSGVFFRYKGRDMQGVVVPNGITTISSYAFENCSADWITLPGSLDFIGTAAFMSCHNLTSIELPEGIQHIGCDCFKACTQLRTVYIPDGVQLIGGGAFENCYNLKDVDLPNSLISINGYAFANCESLKELYLPDNCKMINTAAFYQSDVTLHCAIGSEAAKYAEHQGISYVAHPPKYILQLLPNQQSEEVQLKNVAYRHLISEIKEMFGSSDTSLGQLEQKPELADTTALVDLNADRKNRKVLIINASDDLGLVGLSHHQMERLKQEYSQEQPRRNIQRTEHTGRRR